MYRIFLKSTIVALFSALVSVLIVLSAVPVLGGSVDAGALVMAVVCPVVISFPASAHTFWQKDQLKTALDRLSAAHAELAATHRQLAERASRDAMTGMLNREAFFSRLEASRRKTDRGSLLIIDADHFKRINDTFGHLTGDQALRLISDAIARGVREGDVLGRIGGEEFGAFLTGATDEQALIVAERIRKQVESIRFQPRPGETIPLTVSIGGTVCDEEAGVSDLMRAADKLLYEAKNGGRNLVILRDGLSEAA